MEFGNEDALNGYSISKNALGSVHELTGQEVVMIGLR
jgi:hypothetical protein